MSLRQRLIRDVLSPLVLWHAGDLDERRYLREFERTQWLPREQIEQLQWQRLRKLLDHAYTNCPFYRERFEQAGLMPRDLGRLEDLAWLPVLEKREIQEQGERMVAENWLRADLVPNQTGGSTGTPVAFFLSQDRQRSRTAATQRHNRWAGWDIGDRFAVLWGAPRDAPGQTWRTWLRDVLLGRPLWLDTGHVTEEKLFDFHRELLRFRPQAIQAYARSLLLFARFLAAHKLPVPQVPALVTSAEMLEPDERDFIEGVFGCRLFDRYGCREVSVIASECEAHEGLHVMAEGLYVEIVAGDRPAKPGEAGSILVTDLLNFPMPLIRYRIGDVGAWAEGNCPCGRGLPRLQCVHGRVTDFLTGSDGRLVSGAALTIYIVARRPSLGQVQIEQERAGEVRYRIRPGRNFCYTSDLEYLERTTRQHLGDDTLVLWEFVDEIRSEPSGKFQFSRSSVVPAFARVPEEVAS
jgi:phenylacetate-CoA ligase